MNEGRKILKFRRFAINNTATTRFPASIPQIGAIKLNFITASAIATTAVIALPARLQTVNVPNSRSRRSSADIVKVNGDTRKLSKETAMPNFNPSLEKNQTIVSRKAKSVAPRIADIKKVIVKAVLISCSDNDGF